MGMEKKDFLTIRCLIYRNAIIYWRQHLKKIAFEVRTVLEKDDVDVDKIYDDDIERFVNKFLIQSILEDIPYPDKDKTNNGKKAFDLNLFDDDLRKIKKGLSVTVSPSAIPIAIFSRFNRLVRENTNIANEVVKIIRDDLA